MGCTQKKRPPAQWRTAFGVGTVFNRTTPYLVPTLRVGTQMGALRPSAQERRTAAPTRSVGARSILARSLGHGLKTLDSLGNAVGVVPEGGQDQLVDLAHFLQAFVVVRHLLGRDTVLLA